MAKKITLFFIISISLAQSATTETYNYVVNFFLLPSLDMKMEISCDHETDTGRIDVYTKTKKIFNKIFAIDNHYSTRYSAKNFHCLNHSKKISQPNLKQQLTIKYDSKKIKYSNGEIRKNPGEVMDFFSMLMYLRTVPPAELPSQKILLDMEGEFFQATFQRKPEYLKIGHTKILTDKIKITYTKLHKNQSSVLDYTDIFFWKIASESGDKYIWIEQGKRRRILKAKFSEGNSWLEAKFIEGK